MTGESAGRLSEPLAVIELVQDNHEVAFFRTGSMNVHSGCLAIGIRPWLSRLKKEGVDHLRVSLGKCAPQTRPKEDCGWGVMSDGDVGVELWQPLWKGCPDRQTGRASCRISYSSSRFARWQVARIDSQAEVADDLRTVIDEAIQTCIEQNLKQTFEQIRDMAKDATTWADRFYPLSADPLLRQTLKNAMIAMVLVEEGEWSKAKIDCTDLVSRLWTAAMAGLEAACLPSALLVH